ncbi:MAG: DUF4276 family protein [Gemmataceae bacterium]|nr:DUF4276 family protein [Gemmataceae bacterium]MCI0742097.1 DUF4276 family protein [Gemmataceae bacterium]
MATPPSPLVIEIVGDGKAETGSTSDKPEDPQSGVVTILVYRLCGSPESMKVRRRAPIRLRKGTQLWRRVEQTKVRACDQGDAGLVYVVDSEGNNPVKLRLPLEQGRDAKRRDFPMAIGVAHPCLEAWLLADSAAIQKSHKLNEQPNLPPEPEALPGTPKKNPGAFYKEF